MANFWLNSKKVEGAGVGQTDRAQSISKLRALEPDRQTEQRALASESYRTGQTDGVESIAS